MFSLLRTTLMKFPKQLSFQPCTSLFHTLLKPNQFIETPVRILQPVLKPFVIPQCGFKVKGHLKRRCKDCYFVVRNERLFVLCKTHPRHKQMSMVPKLRTIWQITHATQGKSRPW